MPGQRGRHDTRWLSSMAILALTGCSVQTVLFGPTPPVQPTAGPGSSAYAHQRLTQHYVPDGPCGYHLFEPDDPRPESAPVIVFLHGYSAIDPNAYRAWIRHLVRRGNIVVYPVYQERLATPSAVYTASVIDAVAHAFALLQSGDHVHPHPEHFAIVGHSIGGILAANLAARATDAGLPAPRALMLCNAADVRGALFPRRFQTILEDADYQAIPSDTLLLIVIGDRDVIARKETSFRVYESTPQIPLENKQILLLNSDTYGSPDLRAVHVAAVAVSVAGPESRPVRRMAAADALDYLGYWKWLDALTDAAFDGVHREYALGPASEQTFMGLWSDGTPVRPAEVIRP